MILIYNLGGLLFGLLGFIIGAVIALLTGNLGAGVVAIGIVWLIVGRGKRDAETGLRQPSPAIFFIPLFFWAFPVILLGGVAGVAQVVVVNREKSPEEIAFGRDEDALDANVLGGDRALSQRVADHLVEVVVDELEPQSFHVFSRIKPSAVLILVQVPRLSELADEAKQGLAAEVYGFTAADEAAADKAVYVGLKGRAFLGAVKTPAIAKVDSVVVPSHLHDFYHAADQSNEPELAATDPVNEVPEATEPAKSTTPPFGIATQTPPPDAPPSLAPEEIRDRFVAQLVASDPAMVREAARQLIIQKPLGDPQPVLDALRPHLESSDERTSNYAARAFCLWAGEAELTTLLRIMAEHKDSYTQRMAATAIGKIQDPSTIETLVKCFAATRGSNETATAIEGFGPAAESALIGALGSDESWVQHATIKLLGKIGGTESAVALQESSQKMTRYKAALSFAFADIFRRTAKPLPADMTVTTDMFLVAQIPGGRWELAELLETLPSGKFLIRLPAHNTQQETPRSKLGYLPGRDGEPAKVAAKRQGQSTDTSPDSAESQPAMLLGDQELRPGMRIEAHWGSRWYPAEVLEVEGNGKARVLYITGSKRSEPRDRLRLPPPLGPDDPSPVLADTKLVVGQELQAHWGSKWYDATILELEADGKARVRYSTGTIESLPRLRLRMPPAATGVETPAAN